MKEKFGLIGRVLKHSYSKQIHALFSDYDYNLVELEPDQLKEFVLSGRLKGFNVTIPYKKQIIEYLDWVSPLALEIGAVNTVLNRDGKLYGYNTDFDGMIYMINRAQINLEDKKVVILGSGGTCNTAKAVCKHLKARQVVIVSRSGEINYQNYSVHRDANIIINTTPVGTYPNNYQCPIDLSVFNSLDGVIDVVYNPNKTLLTFNANKFGVKTTNGLPMLVAQAKRAAEIFTGKEIEDEKIEKVVKELESQMQNVVLIGMPGSGKTSIAIELAKRLNREFIDTDQEIEKSAGTDIPSLFSQKGEEYFRELETETVKEVGKLTGKVIATGGGVIKNPENYYPLKSNSKIFWIKRDLEKLMTEGRPLSKDLQTVKRLFDERKEGYNYLADQIIENDNTIETAVKGVIEKL